MRVKQAFLVAVVMLVLLPAFTRAAAASDLLLASLDLSRFPHATAVLQLSGITESDSVSEDAVRVYVDGARAEIVSFRSAAAEPMPNATILLLDESGSMRGDSLAAAKEASRRFLEAARPVDLVGIQSFNEDFRMLHSLSGNKPSLDEALRLLAPRKETALYDALAQSLESLSKVEVAGARSIILLSDGGDTASQRTLQEVLSLARASGVRVYAIGLKTYEFDPKPLQELAAATGGRYLESPAPQALASLFQELAGEISNQYLVTFLVRVPPEGKGSAGLVIEFQRGDLQTRATTTFFYPDIARMPGPASETAEPDGAGRSSADRAVGADSIGRTSTGVLAHPLLLGFAGWSGSRYLVALAVFLLLFAALYVLSGIVFPRRSVLRDYADLLENRRHLAPGAAASTTPSRPGERLLARLLSFRGYGDPLQRRLEDVGWKMRTSEFALLHVGGLFVALLALRFVGASVPVLILATGLLSIAPVVYLDYLAKRQCQRFERQVPEVLIMIANSLRAGQGFEQALKVVADDAPEPTSREFRRLLTQQRLGVEPEKALQALADRMRSESFEWAVMATIIQRRVGGNLAEIYERLAATLREREKLRREAQSLSAEGRYSAMVLVALPFVLAIALFVINREYVSLLWERRLGLLMVAAGLAAMGVGLVWIKRIIRLET